jgi:putative drug exporter of the RND superfamily
MAERLILPIQELGFGLAVAIALDATVIRLVVVPSAMKLMGEWNWWLPGRRTRSVIPVQANPNPPTNGAERTSRHA